MEIEKLRSYIEVYTYRNISKAASHLFLSQSGLSRRIQSIEEELGTTLFLRSGVNLEPTDAGRTFYKEAVKIITQHDNSLIKMSRYRKGISNSLCIGVMDASRMAPILRAVSLMQEKHPDLELNFDCDRNTDIIYYMAEHKIDVGITVLGELSGIEGLEYAVLNENTLSVLVGRRHRLWKKRPIYPEDLTGECLFSYENTPFKQTLSAAVLSLEKAGAHFSAKIPCRSNNELLMYVATGKGVALGALVSNEMFFSFRDQVDVVPIEGINMNQGYVAAVYDGVNKAAKEFVELLKLTC